jgi:hypothetical protein
VAFFQFVLKMGWLQHYRTLNGPKFGKIQAVHEHVNQ